MTKPTPEQEEPVKRCWWHNYQWGKPYKLEMAFFAYGTMVPGSEHVEYYQLGTCSKCGKTKERKV